MEALVIWIRLVRDIDSDRIIGFEASHSILSGFES